MDDVARPSCAPAGGPGKGEPVAAHRRAAPDGYHLLDSVFAAVDLCDTSLLPCTISGVRGAGVEVRCDRPDVPADARISRRARRTCCLRARHRRHVAIELQKRIPPGSGLGGGSSNAATVLAGLTRRSASASTATRLRELASQLGADVPFFLDGGVARVGGIGERWSRSRGRSCISCSRFRRSRCRPRGRSRRTTNGRRAPLPATRPRARAAGLVPDGRLFVNALEAVVFARYPELATLKRDVLAAGAAAAVMSGSGSTILGSAPSPPAAHRIADTLVSAVPTCVSRS